MNQSSVAYQNFILPPSVISRVDVSRLVNEIEQADNAITTLAIRAKAGENVQQSVALSDRLKDFLDMNGLTITADSLARTELVKQMRILKDKAPVVHLTFATEADQDSLSQLAGWLRESVHPQAVIQTGLQPALIAGVYVRTPNRVYDLSMRAQFQNSRGLLVKQLEAHRAGR
jgi:hypothetical protein